LTPPDPEDAPIRVTEGGRVLHVERRLGPIASAEIAPAAALEWSQQPAQLRRVVLSIRAQSDVQPRYGTGFHEQFALLFWGDASEWFSYVSFELIPDGQLHRVELDLTFDPVAAENLSTRLGLLPLNYPGVVTIEDVQVSP
jgi:hypothetical protein